METRITLIHPSRGRPEQAFKTASQWMIRSDKKLCELGYILVVDNDDPLIDKYKEFFPRHFNSHNGNTAIQAINYGASLSTGEILIVISDDFDCPVHWDTLLIEALQGKTDFCAKTIDGHQDWLITLPIMDRVYYKRFGFIYHPSYTHMYADLEMTCIAWMLDCYISLPIEFKHLHPVVTHQPLDPINIRNNESWGQGKSNFRNRMLEGFNIDQINPIPMDKLLKQGIA